MTDKVMTDILTEEQLNIWEGLAKYDLLILPEERDSNSISMTKDDFRQLLHTIRVLKDEVSVLREHNKFLKQGRNLRNDD